jgi:ribosomal-protein-alanine N-acetyltransferase
MEDVKVRRMETLDLDRVMVIERQSYTMPWTEATFRGLLRRSDADLFVAEKQDGTLVGYAVFWAVLDQGELGNVAVAPDWRRRGVAHHLLDAVIKRAGERGVRELFLEVRVSNSTARQLYQAYGFREVGRRRSYYMEPIEDALVMRKDLSAAGTDEIGFEPSD